MIKSALFQPLAGSSSSQRLKDLKARDPFESFRRRIKFPGSLSLSSTSDYRWIVCVLRCFLLCRNFKCRLLKDDSGNERVRKICSLCWVRKRKDAYKRAKLRNWSLIRV
ncbi:hypothetical protein CDAR_23281 [Caerostris darwini]|uniref:Ribosomal protein S14 n=1 Tax=Caerostris darwini TaxID=1538125 RepID=A0AAV4U855_9ARAC|nr:hypothetical protein CDAR_23251 [Caerostris darwini]GIY53981.1 hypothetical protein CDAR_23281 [Caerostris darwini]